MSLISAVELYTADFAEIFFRFFQIFVLCAHIPIILKILLVKSAHPSYFREGKIFMNCHGLLGTTMIGKPTFHG